MTIDQQIGRYGRLKDELAAAYASLPWNLGRIERLNHDLAAAEQAIRHLRRATAQGQLPAHMSA